MIKQESPFEALKHTLVKKAQKVQLDQILSMEVEAYINSNLNELPTCTRLELKSRSIDLIDFLKNLVTRKSIKCNTCIAQLTKIFEMLLQWEKTPKRSISNPNTVDKTTAKV